MNLPTWVQGLLRSVGIIDKPSPEVPEVQAGKRACVITNTQRQWWQRLQNAVPESMTVLFRQRLTEVIEFGEMATDFEKVMLLDRRSIDYVICDDVGEPKLVVMLLDQHAQRQKHVWRQDQAAAILQQAGIPTVRFAMQPGVDERELSTQLAHELQRVGHASSSTSTDPIGSS